MLKKLCNQVTPSKKRRKHPNYLWTGAADFEAENLVGDEPEPLEVIKWPLNKVEELLMRDDFQEARSICALLLTLKKLQEETQGE